MVSAPAPPPPNPLLRSTNTQTPPQRGGFWVHGASGVIDPSAERFSPQRYLRDKKKIGAAERWKLAQRAAGRSFFAQNQKLHISLKKKDYYIFTTAIQSTIVICFFFFLSSLSTNDVIYFIAVPYSPPGSMPSFDHSREHTNLLLVAGRRPPRSCVQISAALENTRSAAQLVPETAR